MALKNAGEWEEFIGEQVKTIRIRRGLTQDELSARAGVSKSALCNLESGKGSTVKTLVAALNVLGETAWIENLAPEITVSPIQLMSLGRPRQRVRRKRKRREAAG
jgi:transcriptional regulator with XRE-family HTH domain